MTTSFLFDNLREDINHNDTILKFVGGTKQAREEGINNALSGKLKSLTFGLECLKENVFEELMRIGEHTQEGAFHAIRSTELEKKLKKTIEEILEIVDKPDFNYITDCVFYVISEAIQLLATRFGLLLNDFLKLSNNKLFTFRLTERADNIDNWHQVRRRCFLLGDTGCTFEFMY